MKLANKFALVTGASTGIGQSVAVELAKNGAFIFLVARTKKRLNKTKQLILKQGGGSGNSTSRPK